MKVKWMWIIGFGIIMGLWMSPMAFSIEKAPVKCLLIGKEPHGEAGILNETLKEIQEKYPSVEITAVEKDKLDVLKFDNLKNYDVLMIEQVQVQDGNPPDFVKEGIVQFLKNGGGLVVSHFAVANMQNWRDSIHVLGSMWVNGKSTHNPKHLFRVDMKEEGHPILDGIKPFTTNDELYFNLLMRPDMHVIMTANEELFGQDDCRTDVDDVLCL